jgi:hypothetical protein
MTNSDKFAPNYYQCTSISSSVIAPSPTFRL